MTNLKRVVGLTGGMGAGKSTIVETIKANGIKVFDCDAEVREIYKDEMFCLSLHEEYGLPAGVDPKEWMSNYVTKHPDILPDLQDLSRDFFDTAFREAVRTIPDNSFLLIDAPILFETGMDKLCDFVIAVQCPIEVRQERVMRRPGMTQEKMNVLMSRQISEADRLMRSHYIIHNTGTIIEVQTKALQIIQHLKEFYQ